VWTEAILSGISLGLVLALLIGPVFFLLIDTGISKGFKAAAFIAGGVVISDAFFVIIAYFSSTAIGFIKTNQSAIGMACGAILIAFGVITFLRKPVLKENVLHLPEYNGQHWKGFGKGFVLNFLNPFVLIFWLGVAGSLAGGQKHTNSFAVVFFVAALSTVFITDLLKAWGAARLKKLIRPVYLLWLNRISGAGLVIFGIRLIWKIL
jgi:threonine/homoserine/homoserine lactone efflux protein